MLGAVVEVVDVVDVVDVVVVVAVAAEALRLPVLKVARASVTDRADASVAPAVRGCFMRTRFVCGCVSADCADEARLRSRHLWFPMVRL
jgi:hypothetical protein